MWCRIYQWAIEKDLDTAGRVQRPFVARHLQRCVNCQAFTDRMTRLERQLRSAPACDISDEQVQHLQDAIWRRLGETPPQTPDTAFRTPVSYHLRYAVSAAAVIVLILLAGLYLQTMKPNHVPDPVSGFVSNAAALQTRMSLLARLPEQSFRTEMQKLANDARSAADFLGNCIPAAPTDIDTTQSINAPTP